MLLELVIDEQIVKLDFSSQNLWLQQGSDRPGETWKTGLFDYYQGNTGKIRKK